MVQTVQAPSVLFSALLRSLAVSWWTGSPQPPVMSFLTLSVLHPGFPLVPLKGPGHANPFWWLRRHCLTQTRWQTEPDSHAVSLSWVAVDGTNGNRSQRGSGARVGTVSSVSFQGIWFLEELSLPSFAYPGKGERNILEQTRRNGKWNHLASLYSPRAAVTRFRLTAF